MFRDVEAWSVSQCRMFRSQLYWAASVTDWYRLVRTKNVLTRKKKLFEAAWEWKFDKHLSSGTREISVVVRSPKYTLREEEIRIRRSLWNAIAEKTERTKWADNVLTKVKYNPEEEVKMDREKNINVFSSGHILEDDEKLRTTNHLSLILLYWGY